MAKTRGARRADYYQTAEGFRGALHACIERAGGQAALGRVSGIPQSTLSGLLSGKHVEMSPETHKRLTRGVAMLSRDQKGSTHPLRMRLDPTIQHPTHPRMSPPKPSDEGGPIIQRPAVVPPISHYIGDAASERLKRGELPNVPTWPVQVFVTVDRQQFACLQKHNADMMLHGSRNVDAIEIVFLSAPATRSR